jgi:hypothetical protein
MVHHNESPGQMSPQPSMKRKKFDDDDLNGSKKARTRVRFVCYSLSRTWIYLKSLIFWGPAILVENATAVSRRYVRMFHADSHIVTTSHSVTAKLPVPTYASLHNINAGDTLNYISSVWLARSLNCVRHIHPVNLIRMLSTFVLLA